MIITKYESVTEFGFRHEHFESLTDKSKNTEYKIFNVQKFKLRHSKKK